MFKLSKFSLAVISGLALTACGGSSDGPNPDDPNTPTPTTYSYVMDVKVAFDSDDKLGNSSVVTNAVHTNMNVVCIDSNDDDSCSGEVVKSTIDNNGVARLSWTEKTDKSEYLDRKVIAVNDSNGILRYSIKNIESTASSEKVLFTPLSLNALSNLQDKLGGVDVLKEAAGLPESVDFSKQGLTNKYYETLNDVFNKLGLTGTEVTDLSVDEIKQQVNGSYDRIKEAFDEQQASKDDIKGKFDEIINSGEGKKDNYFDEPIFEEPNDPKNEAPVAQFSTAITDKTVKFTNESTDKESQDLSYSWNFGNGKSSKEVNPTVTYDKYGTYTVTLKAFDGQKYSSPFTKEITLVCKGDGCEVAPNHAPVVELKYTVDGYSVTFTNTSYDEDGDALVSTYDYGDGSVKVVNNKKIHFYSYKNPGNYTVTLSVTDGVDTTTKEYKLTIKQNFIDCSDGICSDACPQNCSTDCSDGVCSDQCPENCEVDCGDGECRPECPNNCGNELDCTLK